MAISRQLIKEDKNGTKYYHVTDKCGKCGGTGYIGYFAHIYGGECFDCGGSGVVEYQEKEMTPEHEAKLKAKRDAKFEKERLERASKASVMNAEFFQKQGFDQNGKCYVALGNTYEIKDQLKEMGAKFMNNIGWYFPYPVDEFKTVEISVEDIYHTDYAGVYVWNFYLRNDEETYSAKIKEANDALKASQSTSHHIGAVGDKLEIRVTVKMVRYFDYKITSWQTVTTWMYKMVDEDGNVLIWKASSHQDMNEGDVVTIKGTIKEHSEYDGELQTVLTRCKVL